MELKSIDPLHLCCDNCKSQCKCELCMDSVTEAATVACPTPVQVTDKARQAAKHALLSYFAQENAIPLAQDQLVPHLSTGLSEDLADQISRDDSIYDNTNCREYLTELYPHLPQIYIGNIDTIISKVRDLHL